MLAAPAIVRVAALMPVSVAVTTNLSLAEITALLADDANMHGADDEIEAARAFIKEHEEKRGVVA